MGGGEGVREGEPSFRSPFSEESSRMSKSSSRFVSLKEGEGRGGEGRGGEGRGGEI